MRIEIEHEQDDLESETTSTSRLPGMYTPSPTTATNSVVGDTTVDNEEVPWHGRTFIIVDDRNRAITLVDGNLKVEDNHDKSHRSCWLWDCVETNG